MRQDEADVVVELVASLSTQVGVADACAALAVPRSWYYRQQAPAQAAEKPAAQRPAPPNALSAAEKAAVRAVLNSERFCDQPPREVYATLLDEETYLCHWRTMYRILAEHEEVGDRRGQRRHRRYAKPELVARAPNQVWSWDISYLAGRGRRTFFYLYVIVDIFSRYVPGWMVAEAESALWAREFIAATCGKQEISAAQLTLHADRGSAMKARTVAELLESLGVDQSHSRPHTPNDNPFSEAQFKTLKYAPTFPQEFADIEEARSWARSFFHWYNHEHHHVSLGLMTPAVVHYRQDEQVRAQRQQVLDQAYACHPERFVRGAPQAPSLPEEVWINPPEQPACTPLVAQTVEECTVEAATLAHELWPNRGEKSPLFMNSELSQCA